MSWGGCDQDVVDEREVVDRDSLILDLEEEIIDLKVILRDALRVLHQTNIPKKEIATRMRVALGMRPDERLRKQART